MAKLPTLFKHSSLISLALVLAVPTHAESLPYLSTAIPPEQVRQLQSDLHQLEALPVAPANPLLQAWLGLPDTRAQTLLAWLWTRIRYLTTGPELHFRLQLAGGRTEDATLPAAPDAQYLIDIYGLMETWFRPEHPDAQGFAVIVDEQHVLPVTAAPDLNLGVANLGPRAFQDRYPPLPDSPLNAVNRISVLFHEARHSQGPRYNHVPCPPGTVLAGTPNCDDRPDGAYGLQAEVALHFLKACPSLSPGELMSANTLLADWRRRVATKR